MSKFYEVEVPDDVENQSLATRAGQIRSAGKGLLDRKRQAENLPTNPAPRHMQGGVDERHDKAAQNLKKRVDVYEQEFSLRRRVNDFWRDLIPELEALVGDAKEAHQAAIREVREAFDKAGIYPLDAEEPRRGSLHGQLIHNHPDVHAALWEGVKGAKGRVKAAKKAIQKNEKAAAKVRSKLERAQKRLQGVERQRKQSKAKAEAAEAERKRRADRRAKEDAKIDAGRHPFDADKAALEGENSDGVRRSQPLKA
jgi:hypothetical protein